jgi:hypothetical protein
MAAVVGKAPRVRIGAEGRVFAAEGHDFREGGGAIRVGDVAALGGVHHVAATPEVVEGVVDGDHADAVFVGELDGFLDGGVTGGLAELAIGVPDGGAAETGFHFLDLGLRHAALGAGAEEVVEVEGLEAVVRADAVARGLGAEARAGFGFGLRVTAMFIRGDDEGVVLFFGNDVENFGHGRSRRS